MSVFSQFKFKDLLVDAVIQQCPAQQELGTCTPTLDFSFDNGGIVSLRFPSPDKLIDFCKKHNFPVEDERNAE